MIRTASTLSIDSEHADKGDKAHLITHNIYKDLQTNYLTGLKNVWSSGKALHKALEAVSQKAAAHHDAIFLLGQTACSSSATIHGLGDALIQMAEAYKEIQKQYDENIAALKKELCNPMEFILLDTSEKMEDKLKIYMRDHARLLEPYKKASTNLQKHRKKNKGALKNPKEMQYFREANESKKQLERFQLKSLKEALTDEKGYYAFVAERLLLMVRNHATHFRKAQELLTHRAADWAELVKDKEITANDLRLLDIFTDEYTNGNMPPLQITSAADHPTSIERSPAWPLTHVGAWCETDSSTQQDPEVLPAPTEQPLTERPCVQALYDHVGEEDNQMSFQEGDVLFLQGEQKGGWHYGQNARTKLYGWFPIKFTETLKRKNSFSQDQTQTSSYLSKSHSVADLTSSDDHTPTRHSHFQFPMLSHTAEDYSRSVMTLPHKKTHITQSFTANGRAPYSPPTSHQECMNTSDLPPPPPEINGFSVDMSEARSLTVTLRSQTQNPSSCRIAGAPSPLGRKSSGGIAVPPPLPTGKKPQIGLQRSSLAAPTPLPISSIPRGTPVWHAPTLSFFAGGVPPPPPIQPMLKK